MHNPFILNPAVAGTVNYFQIRSINRFQWIGFGDAPVTNSLSFYGPVSAKNKDMGYGATVYDDITGLVSNAGLRGAYAYNLALNDQIRLSFGAAFGLMQYKYDGTQSNVPDGYDLPEFKTTKTFYFPDGVIGTYVYSNNFQVGFSADNLFNNKINIDNQAAGLSKLKSHFYLLGSYEYYFNRRWAVELSMMIRGVSPAPLQFDLNCKVEYLKIYWFGASYRYLDAISFMGGYIFNKRILLGLSYDYDTSPIRTNTLGSIEFMIGYRFNSLR